MDEDEDIETGSAAPAPAAPRGRGRPRGSTNHRAAARAPARTAAREAREPVRDVVREQPMDTDRRLQRRSRRNSDQFSIDKRLIPAGMTYEWKAETVIGQPQTAAMLEYRENGWTPVPTGRHPFLMPEGTEKSAPIRLGGQMLMERPLYLTKEARQEMYNDAIQALTGREEAATATPHGTLSRSAPAIRDHQRISHQTGATVISIPD